LSALSSLTAPPIRAAK